MIDSQDLGFADFYRRQMKKAASLETLRLVLVVGVGAALLGLLGFLGSPLLVWAYVIVLYAATYYGARRLQRAINVFLAASKHLLELAQFLTDSRSRAELVHEVKKRIDSNDDSNVPEAIWSYCRGGDRSEGIRVVANSAFAHPVTELAVASFLRTALVLGGLFGTVLFFAIELGDHGVAGGDLTELLPGLRGALASTLTGILGSLVLGILASGIERMVDQAIWETESFVCGPVSQALASETADAGIRDETDLWTALRHEVAQLSRETTAAYGRLADDASAYAKALEAVSQQLTELPAVQVPPQIVELGEATGKFARGTELLDRTVTTLVNAVATIGLMVPTKVLDDLQELRTGTARLIDDSTELRTIGGTLSSVSSDIGRLHERIVTSAELIQATETLTAAIDAGTNTSVGAAERVADKVGELRDEVERIGRPAALAVAANIADPNSRDGATETVREADKSSGLAAELSRNLEHLNKEVGALQGILTRVASRLTRLESVYTWHDRAARAPLMKLMLLPLWPSKRKGVSIAP